MKEESREDKPEYQKGPEWLPRDGLNKDWCTKPATPSEEAPKNTRSIQQHCIKTLIVGITHHPYIAGVYCRYCSVIRESVDSLCRDGADAQYMQYLSKSRITSPQTHKKLI